MNDKDIGGIILKCIKLCAKAGGRFCESLYNVAIDERFYKNVFGEDKQVQKKKIILDLINICKEKIFEYVDNQFLLENLDNEMIKNMFAYADKSKITSILKYIGESNKDNKKKMSDYLKLIELIKNNPKIDKETICKYINNDILLANLDNEIIKDLITHVSKDKRYLILNDVNALSDDDQAKIDIYLKLIKYRPDVLSLVQLNEFSSNQNFMKALSQSVKNVAVLSFLNNCQENEKCIKDFFSGVSIMQTSEEKTQIINAVSCLDSPSLKETLTDKYMFRNLACIKYNLDDNDSFGGLPLDRRALAFNLFKIHNQQNCDLNLTDLVAANHRLCCETIDFHFPEYKNLAKIIRLSYKKHLWFIWIAFSIFVIALVCSVLFKVLLVAVMSTILIYYLIFECFVLDSITFKKIFLPLSLKKYETKIKHEKEARHGFYSFLKNKFDFKTHIDIYNKTLESVKNKNIDIKKDFFDWLKANKKDGPFNKENDRNKKIGFVVDFILRAPNNEIIKKLDSEIKKLGDFSNDNNARNLITVWLSLHPNYNDCGNTLQSEESLDMIKFKDGESKTKLKRKDSIKVLAEKVYGQIICPQDKNLVLQNKKESENKEEINTSAKNIIDNDILIPQSEVSRKNQNCTSEPLK